MNFSYLLAFVAVAQFSVMAVPTNGPYWQFNADSCKQALLDLRDHHTSPLQVTLSEIPNNSIIGRGSVLHTQVNEMIKVYKSPSVDLSSITTVYKEVRSLAESVQAIPRAERPKCMGTDGRDYCQLALMRLQLAVEKVIGVCGHENALKGTDLYRPAKIIHRSVSYE